MLVILSYLVLTSFCFFYFVAWKELDVYLRRCFVFTNTKQKLKAIREYDNIYLYMAGAIMTAGAIFIFGLSYYFQVVTIAYNYGISFGSMISSLEKGELNYTCTFGISFQSVKCEIYSSINRAAFYVITHFLKWLQETFSMSAGLNPFKILSSLSLFYQILTASIHPDVFYVIIRRAFNNLVHLFYMIVYACHAIHNWRQIVQNVQDDTIPVDESNEVNDGADVRRERARNALVSMQGRTNARSRSNNDR